MKKPDWTRVGQILEEAKLLAAEYYIETGKPLGITSEVAEFEAASRLGLQLLEARNPGYDAIRVDGQASKCIQIKGCRVMGKLKPGHRMAAINPKKKWDSVVLVILDEYFEPLEIHEADRVAVLEALRRPGSIARNKRGQLAVSQFKRLGTCKWKRPSTRTLPG